MQSQRDSHLVTHHRALSTLEKRQKAMWVELVDVLMIDVGFTDVTWSHAWNSVCGGSNHHFLLA